MSYGVFKATDVAVTPLGYEDMAVAPPPQTVERTPVESVTYQKWLEE